MPRSLRWWRDATSTRAAPRRRSRTLLRCSRPPSGPAIVVVVHPARKPCASVAGAPIDPYRQEPQAPARHHRSCWPSWLRFCRFASDPITGPAVVVGWQLFDGIACLPESGQGGARGMGLPAELSAQCRDLAASAGFQQPDQAIPFGGASRRAQGRSGALPGRSGLTWVGFRRPSSPPCLAMGWSPGLSPR
jgi:hypothetical protein